MTGALARGGRQKDVPDPDLVVFHRGFANFPWRSHALWLMTQMIRWGQVREPFDLKALAAQVFRTDLFREAVAAMDVALPASDGKPEGGDQGGVFFGGETFDPGAALTYLDKLAIRNRGADLAGFSIINP